MKTQEHIAVESLQDKLARTERLAAGLLMTLRCHEGDLSEGRVNLLSSYAAGRVRLFKEFKDLSEQIIAMSYDIQPHIQP
jgi:hypothetical protein